MRLKVLGAYGASDAEHNLTGYLIDDWFAVDAGTLTSKLSFAQQARIQAVFITHSHATPRFTSKTAFHLQHHSSCWRRRKQALTASTSSSR